MDGRAAVCWQKPDQWEVGSQNWKEPNSQSEALEKASKVYLNFASLGSKTNMIPAGLHENALSLLDLVSGSV